MEIVDIFAEGCPVQLEDVLKNRDWRVAVQDHLMQHFSTSTVVAVKLNVPGEVKNSPSIKQLFFAGWRLLLSKMSSMAVQKVTVEADRLTGPEGFFVINRELEEVKKEAIRFEEHFFLGRLFDIDVMTLHAPAYQLSRQELGFAPRTCLICSENAKECARSGKHDISALRDNINQIYTDYFVIDPVIPAWDQETVAKAATFACLAEAVTWPKPGLVDPVSNGAHQDMDIYSFLDSSLSLENYFKKCFEAGRTFRGDQLTALLSTIRPSGRFAEGRMFQVTDGVNTHKGTIFSLGILIAAYGYASRNEQSPSLSFVQTVVSRMGAQLVENDLKEKFSPSGLTDSKGDADKKVFKGNANRPSTAGEQQYQDYQLTGVRGEIAGGLRPLSTVGLKTLRESRGTTRVRLLNTLMALATSITDSTMIKRYGDPKISQQLNQWVQEFEARGGAESKGGQDYLASLDQAFIEKNLSMGGAADYLILTIFIGRLTGLL
ncbi:citrate lyase holo-[acyl-carrier protein] synthase [Fructobacillus sp. M1-13]|uniref:Citrate lyase holo-[acyl-carrier protein] synthase n=1 Tax=Fructobacillus papyriferae TaxID=2713171 RepID=A0ABS5QNG9_9LACO|nr:citrate lyase holo-[acyl-carrier protein] synthase [Fructobacillus papyriferae]MBS9334556.1 citrate lyase holo-[acyl-carrier protein] synthase [Fructobacillus papyriferae]MCD2158545.1 citrate lyase holo-[acyl-carrier protein] synthase [Fructobacillus papyriferae]